MNKVIIFCLLLLTSCSLKKNFSSSSTFLGDSGWQQPECSPNMNIFPEDTIPGPNKKMIIIPLFEEVNFPNDGIYDFVLWPDTTIFYKDTSYLNRIKTNTRFIVDPVIPSSSKIKRSGFFIFIDNKVH